MKIRKNDRVKINNDLTVGTYHVQTLPAGTELKVWKASRKGELYCTTVDRNLGYHTIITNEESVTKIDVPLPKVNTGDIFVASWGYDQTNIDFYKVVEVKNKSAVLVHLGANRTYTGHMQGTCVPDMSVVGTRRYVKRIQVVDNKPCFKLTSYSAAFPWCGKEQHFTEWA